MGSYKEVSSIYFFLVLLIAVFIKNPILLKTLLSVGWSPIFIIFYMEQNVDSPNSGVTCFFYFFLLLAYIASSTAIIILNPGG